jgi:hypothetical protein
LPTVENILIFLSHFKKEILILTKMNFHFAFFIYLRIIVPFISTMLEIDLRNQTNEFVEWMETHAFKNTQFHMDENDEDTNIIYFKFSNFTQLSSIKCTNLSIETKNPLLYAERRVIKNTKRQAKIITI